MAKWGETRGYHKDPFISEFVHELVLGMEKMNEYKKDVKEVEFVFVKNLEKNKIEVPNEIVEEIKAWKENNEILTEQTINSMKLVIETLKSGGKRKLSVIKPLMIEILRNIEKIRSPDERLIEFIEKNQLNAPYLAFKDCVEKLSWIERMIDHNLKLI